MTNSPRTPVPSALREALEQRTDGAALGELWNALPSAEAHPDDAESRTRREAAWQRVAARIHDPERSLTVEAPPIAVLPDEGVVARRTNALFRNTREPHPFARRFSVTAWRVAATLAVLLGGAGLWQSVPERHAVVAGAAPKTMMLVDGSTVTLAPGSELRVARGFRAWFGAQLPVRDVQLSGEAFFDVARDGRPFTVMTGDAVVRVLGTHFDVRSATASSGTRVLVEEGRVSVEGRVGTAVALTLAAGDAAVIGVSGAAERRKVASITQATSWRTGGLSAVNESLGDVLADLERRTGVEIVLERGVAAESTVTFFYAEAPSLERVLADLSAARGLRFTRTSRGFRVSAVSQPQ